MSSDVEHFSNSDVRAHYTGDLLAPSYLGRDNIPIGSAHIYNVDNGLVTSWGGQMLVPLSANTPIGQVSAFITPRRRAWAVSQFCSLDI